MLSRVAIMEKVLELRKLECLDDSDVSWRVNGEAKDANGQPNGFLVMVPYVPLDTVYRYLEQYFEGQFSIIVDPFPSCVKATIQIVDENGAVVIAHSDVSDIKETKFGKENENSDAAASTVAVRRAFRHFSQAISEVWNSERTVQAQGDGSNKYPKPVVVISWKYVLEQYFLQKRRFIRISK